MTDKEAINYLQQLYPNGGHCWLDEQRIEAIDMAVKALQEEPVAPKLLKDMLNAKTSAESLGISQEEHDRIVDECLYGKEPELVDFDNLPKEEPVSEIDFEQELYKAFGHVKDFTLCLKIARRFYEMGRNHQEPVSDDLEKIVEEIAEPTILNAYGTKELARRLRNTICGTSVSEDLEEAVNAYIGYAPEVDESSSVYGKRQAFKAGAEWQINKLPKWRHTPIKGGCWSGEIGVRPTARLFVYEHYSINADKLFKLLNRED